MRFANPFSDLYRHRDLVVQFTRRELEARHRGSHLGHLWSILKPLTLLGLYVFIFGFIFGGKFGVIPHETTFDFTLGIFMGLSLFNVIAEAMGAAPLLIVSQPNFVKRVVFPLDVIPFSSVTTSLYHSLLSVALLLIAASFSHEGVDWLGALALPLLILPLFFMALAVAWGFAALGVFVRDINQLVPLLSTGVMYASAIVYSPEKVPPAIYAVLKYNPLLQVVAQARRIVLWHLPPNYGALEYAYAASIVMLAIGYGLFAVLRPYFAEVI
ncbi:MAG: ABC transporter permease [Opitutaceae bacterium]